MLIFGQLWISLLFSLLFYCLIFLILTIGLIRNGHLQSCPDKRNNVFFAHPSSVVYAKHICNFNYTLRGFAEFKHLILR